MSAKRNQTSSSGSPIGSPLSPDSSSKEHDRFLPIANVSRIMKKSLPANAKISKEAKETVQECVSEFISFITGEASDKCQREKRKTINGDDLLWAMTTLGFENYVGPLKVYLNKYREVEEEKNSMAMVRQEELSPTHTTTTSNHEMVHGSSSSRVAYNSFPNKVDFQDFSVGGFYSIGGPKNSNGEISGMVNIGYGDNYMSGIHETGGGGHGNPNRAVVAAQLHHGNIGW
ncbi:nuclear transcription factor Y subunit B-like [Humulus lupulus]|uniref:nuclear transcription factor Y subunit B-like n=1 Tax=Humulus lupulus TaxID=3486 RepID=UPI002B40E275|nr:nuclear transcription factor Y subunit B-like [Humulus lupulus]